MDAIALQYRGAMITVFALALGCQPDPAVVGVSLAGPSQIRVDHLGPVEPPAVLRSGVEVDAVTWTVETPEVAAATDGELLAKAPGSTRVYTEVDGEEVAFTLVVAPAVTLSFLSVPATVAVSEELDLDLAAKSGGRDVEPQHISWSSSNEDVVTVDAQGHIVPLQPGTAYITATASGSEAMVELVVE